MLPPGAALAGRSAAYLFHADVIGTDDAPVEVAVPATTSIRAHPRLYLRRTRLDPGDVTAFGTIPVTTPVRTAFDLARLPSLVAAVVAVDALLAARQTTLPQLRDYFEERRDWPRGSRVRRTLRLAAVGAESPMETRLRLLIVLAGLPEPVVQYDVPAARARLDLAYPEAKVAIEYDGDHHRERDRFRRDIARLNRLRLLGWTVLRFTADDVLRHPERLVAQVRQVLGPDLLGHRATLGQ